MALIKLTNSGFTLIDEGVTIFKITEVEYDEDFGKVKVKMQTQAGKTHTEQFSLIKNNGEVNEGAYKAFSFFAKTALNNFNLDEIDHTDLVGCYIQAEVKHEEYESNKEPGKMYKNARLNNYKTAVGFGSAEESKDDELDDLDELDELDINDDDLPF